MLLGFSGHPNSHYSARDTIHNYYEQLVIDQLLRSNNRAVKDPDFLADATCVALNRLPPRYIRYDVDMTFFLSPQEMDEMTDKVVRAVNEAVQYVEERELQKNRDYLPPEALNPESSPPNALAPKAAKASEKEAKTSKRSKSKK